jgi:hypothetical protein
VPQSLGPATPEDVGVTVTLNTTPAPTTTELSITVTLATGTAGAKVGEKTIRIYTENGTASAKIMIVE